MQKNTWQKIRQKVKRNICVYLFPNWIKKQLSQRQGICLQCGRCCNLVFRCPMLKNKNSFTLCRIYNYRPKVCGLFPISEADLKDVDYQCGYSFQNAKN